MDLVQFSVEATLHVIFMTQHPKNVRCSFIVDVEGTVTGFQLWTNAKQLAVSKTIVTMYPLVNCKCYCRH